MTLKLAEIAQRISQATGRDEQSVYNTVRKIRDRGILTNSSFEGTVAFYPEVELVRAAVIYELMQHGLDGMGLQKIGRCLENHNAQSPVGESHSVGFARVVDGLANGEKWEFRFHAKTLKNYVGACRLDGSQRVRNQVEFSPLCVWTTVDLNEICKRLEFTRNIDR